MILNLFSRTPESSSIASFYGAIVAQARAPGFYRVYGVPDTVNGRFEMIVLHAVLVLSRLDSEADAAAARSLGQAVFDYFCSDMDANLREMGVGDITVPRQMKAIGEAFYGRKRAYEAALGDAESDRASLIPALARNVFGSDPDAAPGAPHLAAYVVEAASRLAALDMTALRSGQFNFPEPLPLKPEQVTHAPR